VTNLLLSLRGSGWLPRDPALRFVSTGIVFYLIVSLQGSVQAQMSLNQRVHFTDWVVAHSHLAMLGFASFAAAGGLIHAWQRMPEARYHAGALSWAYWLMTVGLVLMVADLTIAGLVQGQLWLDGAPWIDSVAASRKYWAARTHIGGLLSGGFILLLAGLTTGPRGGGLSVRPEGGDPIAQSRTHLAPGLAGEHA
jgi:cbb3-type cytochrome oxidase subunit 1